MATRLTREEREKSERMEAEKWSTRLDASRGVVFRARKVCLVPRTVVTDEGTDGECGE